MSNLFDLHTAIHAVCPIDGVSIGDVADKATWRIDLKPEATDEQRDAAHAVVADFPAPIEPEGPAA